MTESPVRGLSWAGMPAHADTEARFLHNHLLESTLKSDFDVWVVGPNSDSGKEIEAQSEGVLPRWWFHLYSHFGCGLWNSWYTRMTTPPPHLLIKTLLFLLIFNTLLLTPKKYSICHHIPLEPAASPRNFPQMTLNVSRTVMCVDHQVDGFMVTHCWDCGQARLWRRLVEKEAKKIPEVSTLGKLGRFHGPLA